MYGHNNINMRWMKLIMYNSQETPKKLLFANIIVHIQERIPHETTQEINQYTLFHAWVKYV